MNTQPTDGQKVAETKLEDSILSVEEYLKITHGCPYKYQLFSRGKQLTYYGVEHSSDPKNPMFLDIKSEIDAIKPDMVLVEGMDKLKDRVEQVKEKRKNLSIEELIARYGEPGYTAALAMDRGIEIDSPEPDFGEEVKYVESLGYPRAAMFVYYCGRVALQRLRMLERPDIAQYMESYLIMFKSATNWQNFDYSLSNLLKLCKSFSQYPFDSESLNSFQKLLDPIPYDGLHYGVINKVSAASMKYRDVTALRRIKEALHAKNNIYIVYGASHAVMLEPALRKLMKNAE